MRETILGALCGVILFAAGLGVGMMINPNPTITQQLANIGQKVDKINYFLTGK